MDAIVTIVKVRPGYYPSKGDVRAMSGDELDAWHEELLDGTHTIDDPEENEAARYSLGLVNKRRKAIL